MTQSVTVYSKPRCQQCTATKRWMKEHHVDFVEDDATEPGNLEAITFLGYLQAPVTIVTHDDGTESHWSGFNPTELERHFGKAA